MSRKPKRSNPSRPPQRDYTPILLIGGLALLLTRNENNLFGIGGSGKPVAAMDNAAVYARETVSADTYRRIAGRRDGMLYIVCEGSLGDRITFTSPANGVFTRNVIFEDKTVLAEIRPAG